MDERRIAACVAALLDDHTRQGGALSEDDINRVTDRRRLAPEESSEVRHRLIALGLVPKAPEQVTEDVDRAPRALLPARGGYALEDGLGRYLNAISQTKLLNPDEEIKLSRRIKASREALISAGRSGKSNANSAAQVRDGLRAEEMFIVANLRLVVSIARRYASQVHNMDLDDLIQEGTLGLMTAVAKFDHTKGFKFSTYATWWIKQRITRAIADMERVVRVPVHLLETISKIRSREARLGLVLGRPPTLRELAEALGMEPETVQFARDVGRPAVSLDAPVGDEDLTLGDFLENRWITDDPASVADDVLCREAVERLLGFLHPRDRHVVRHRFGFHNDTPETLEEVGRMFGLTRERIRQVQNKAIDSLKDRAEHLGMEEFLRAN
jgi:RNA polymerase primary sigma factor